MLSKLVPYVDIATRSIKITKPVLPITVSQLLQMAVCVCVSVCVCLCVHYMFIIL